MANATSEMLHVVAQRFDRLGRADEDLNRRILGREEVRLLREVADAVENVDQRPGVAIGGRYFGIEGARGLEAGFDQCERLPQSRMHEAGHGDRHPESIGLEDRVPEFLLIVGCGHGSIGLHPLQDFLKFGDRVLAWCIRDRLLAAEGFRYHNKALAHVLDQLTDVVILT